MVEVANLTWVVGPTCCFSVVCVAGCSCSSFDPVFRNSLDTFSSLQSHSKLFNFPLQPRRLLQPSKYYFIAYWPDCRD